MYIYVVVVVVVLSQLRHTWKRRRDAGEVPAHVAGVAEDHFVAAFRAPAYLPKHSSLYTHTHTHTHKRIQIDRQIERERERERERDRHRHVKHMLVKGQQVGWCTPGSTSP